MDWHPFALRFPAIPPGEEWEAFKTSIAKSNGNNIDILYRMSQGKKQGLDGRNREKACEELDIPCNSRMVEVADEDVKMFIVAMNIHRRHMTQELRREIVAELHADGKSTREIAAALGTSQSTVTRDIGENIGSESFDSRGNNSDAETPNATPPKVTGRDGKSYPASKPVIRCRRCMTILPNSTESITPDCKGCAAAREEAKAEKPPDKPSVQPEAQGSTSTPMADPAPPTDEAGKTWTPKALAVVAEIPRLNAFRNKINEILKLITGSKDEDGDPTGDGLTASKLSNHIDFMDILKAFKQAKNLLLAGHPKYVCPYCSGKGVHAGSPCKPCRGDGAVPKGIWANAPGTNT